MSKNEQSAEATVREIRRKTRRRFSAEEKIRDRAGGTSWRAKHQGNCAAARGSCRICTIAGSKDFLEAGKNRLAGDSVREATSNEVKELRKENRELKVLAETLLHNRVLKKSLMDSGGEEDGDI